MRKLLLPAILLQALATWAGAPSQEATIQVEAGQVLHPVSRYLTGACIEDVNHEIYGGLYSQMIFGESFQEPAPLPEPAGLTAYGGRRPVQVSGMWRAVSVGSAVGTWAIEKRRAFVGAQSQGLSLIEGKGAVGIENQGLNRWGMHFVGGQPYEGILWARAEKPCEVWVALESAGGASILAEQGLAVTSNDWERIEFSLIPAATESKGRFAIRLKGPGSVGLGYVSLQPGPWGRFKDLPVRRDVAEGLLDQGITVLRYGGSMVNHPEYRWKKMIGPRGRRPPYHGTWYPYSSNGWGIFDFMAFCEAAGFQDIPAVNIDETPQDMAEFIEYAKGPAASEWGARRVADGHPLPYRLRYLELGNEERVNDDYVAKFQALAQAIWARDPDIILVVGDFAYDRVIEDPFHFTGAAGGITTLAAQQKILRLAKANHREVWFDLHVWTEGPRPASSLEGTLSFRKALEEVADGASFHVAVFELNANNHSQRRALANALAIQAFERDGHFPVVTSANGLQPDGQNDNGWDQGLLFLNPSQVWLEPPGYVTRMISRNYQPLLVRSEVTGGGHDLDVTAKRSEDGKSLVVQVVNVGEQIQMAALRLEGFIPAEAEARVQELCGALGAADDAVWPARVACREALWRHGGCDGKTPYAPYAFPPRSFTVMVFR